MRIESTGIYTRDGQPSKITSGKSDFRKPALSPQDIKKPETPTQSFAALLSDAETTQLTKLFGKFDLKDLAGNPPADPEDNRPGQIIDILV